MKTAELEGAELDYWTAKAEGLELPSIHVLPVYNDEVCILGGICKEGGPEVYRPSIDWSKGGPIIERERIELVNGDERGKWEATIGAETRHHEEYGECNSYLFLFGPTPLIAAMRALVSSKYGEEVE